MHLLSRPSKWMHVHMYSFQLKCSGVSRITDDSGDAKATSFISFHCLGRGRSLGGSSGGISPSDSPQISPVAEGHHPFAQPTQGKAAAGSKWLSLETEGALVMMWR